MNLATLKAELEDDPVGIGYTGNDIIDAELMNHAIRSGYKPLGSRALLAWGAANGRLSKINDAANRVSVFDAINPAIRSVAMAADRMLSRPDTELDLSNAAHVGLVDALVAGGVLTAGDKTELLAMAATTIGRGEELGLGHVTPSNVADARRLI